MTSPEDVHATIGALLKQCPPEIPPALQILAEGPVGITGHVTGANFDLGITSERSTINHANAAHWSRYLAERAEQIGSTAQTPEHLESYLRNLAQAQTLESDADHYATSAAEQTALLIELASSTEGLVLTDRLFRRDAYKKIAAGAGSLALLGGAAVGYGAKKHGLDVSLISGGMTTLLIGMASSATLPFMLPNRLVQRSARRLKRKILDEAQT